MAITLENQIRRFSEAKLDKELAFARGFAPYTSEAGQRWHDLLEAEAKRRNHPDREWRERCARN